MARSGGSGLDRATGTIRAWCNRHTNDHQECEACRHAAARTLLVHSFRDDALGHIAATERLEPAAHTDRVFFFAGPCRRRVSGLVGALFFKPSAEKVLALRSRGARAEPYDSGGLVRYSGLTVEERNACRRTFEMPVPGYRAYLGALLHCAFDAPHAYLDDAQAPALDSSKRRRSYAERGLWKALTCRDRKGDPDPCGWTVEVQISTAAGDIDLRALASDDLVAAAVIADPAHVRPILKLRALLGGDRVKVLSPPISTGLGAASIRDRMRKPRYLEVAALSAQLQQAAWRV